MTHRKISRAAAIGAAAIALATASQASAALTVFQTYTGAFGLSTDGGGSVSSSSYDINAFVPLGATVTAAYLYQSTHDFSSTTPPSALGMSLNGTAVAFGPRIANGTACCNLASARADVTSILKPLIDGGVGGTYTFNVTETNTLNTDGAALVVVYSLASLAQSTVAILDGFASVTGDTTTVNFTTPLDTTVPGFTSDIRLGIGFSCCDQKSTVNVNGTLISANAGLNDDGTGGGFNGNLITVGGNDDPFSTLLPTYENDRERYDLTPYITNGDTSITIRTANASADDNIFLLAGIFSGSASVVSGAVPEPGTWAMMLAGFGIVGGAMRRRRRTSVSFG